MEAHVIQFAKFYEKRHTGRKLTWYHHLDRADVRLNYLDRKYEVTVAIHQVIVLELYNTKTQYTLKEIEELSKVPTAELGKILKGLLESKLILFHEETGMYELNFSFSRF